MNKLKIAYSGCFLKEGFLEVDVQVIPLRLDRETPLHISLVEFEELHGRPNLVLIEFLGLYSCKIQELSKLVDYPVPLAVYAMDSSLNMYYYKYLLKFFDYVFLDQRASVQDLQKLGIEAHWLPLCVRSSYFREKKDSHLGITFVGRTGGERLKRTNLLTKIFKNFPDVQDFQVLQGLSIEEVQDVFASSKAVLNENLFSGLTLRVFQALASGSLLLTEANSDGLDKYFKDKKHLICYTPDTLIPLMQDILQHYQKYEQIAKNGQEECLEHHTSIARLYELFEYIYTKNKYKFNAEKMEQIEIQKNSHFYKKNEINCKLNEEMLYNSAHCQLRFIQVHGGNYQEVILSLQNLIKSSNSQFWIVKAQFLLACIYANIPNNSKAEELFLSSYTCLTKLKNENNLSTDLSKIYKLEILLVSHLAIFYFLQKNYLKAFWFKELAIQNLPNLSHERIKEIFPHVQYNISTINAENELKIESNIYFSIAQIYAMIGNIFEIGYKKHRDLLPSDAISLALTVWRKSYNTNILDFLLEHLTKLEIAGQILPELDKAIKLKKVTQEQKMKILAIAKAYYFSI